MILRTQKTIVLFAWGLTLLFLPWHWFGGSSIATVLVPDFENSVIGQFFYWWLCTFFATTAVALALGLKNILLAVPILLFLPIAFFVAAFSAQYSDARPMYLSLLFFLFFATCVPLLIRAYKNEKKRHKIYQAALLLMVLLASTFMLFA
ncbi:MAG: hypothetical protein M1551_01725 [Firmicutes bacterium]|nr:hypothetical protein [Bacillota bacterium]